MSDNRFNPSSADRKNPYENLAPRDPNQQSTQGGLGLTGAASSGAPNGAGSSMTSSAGLSPMAPSSLSSLRATSAGGAGGIAQFPATGSTIPSSTVPSSLFSMRTPGGSPGVSGTGMGTAGGTIASNGASAASSVPGVPSASPVSGAPGVSSVPGVPSASFVAGVPAGAVTPGVSTAPVTASGTYPNPLGQIPVQTTVPVGKLGGTQVRNPWGTPPSYAPSSSPSHPPSYPPTGHTQSGALGAAGQGSASFGQGAAGVGPVPAGAVGATGVASARGPQVPIYRRLWFVALVVGVFAFLTGFAVGESSVREELRAAEAENSSLQVEIDDLKEQVRRLQNQADGGGGSSDLDGLGSWFGFGGGSAFPDTFSGDGVFLVGYDIDPGTYETPGRDGCIWTRVPEDFYLEDVTEMSPDAMEVTIEPGDFAFVSTGCADWTRVD